MQLRDPAQLAPEFSRHPFGRENQDRSCFRGIGPKNLQLTVDLAFVGNDHAQRRLNSSAFEPRCFQIARQTETDVVAFKRAVTEQDRIRERALPKQMQLVLSRVVILPSTVMAKVALTNGREIRDRMLRSRCRGSRRLPDFLVGTPAASPTTLLRLLDFMLHRRHFASHFANANTFRDAARFVEEVNDAARRAADQNHEKAE